MQLATEKQQNLLKKLNIEFNENITIKEASILIAKTLKQNRQNKNTNTNNTESKQATKTIKQSVFNKDIFNEFKTKYYQTQFSYYKEKKFDTEYKYIIKLHDNKFIMFDNPHIETHFCFGYGYCGISTVEEEKNACEMREYAATNENYFIKENLKQLNSQIEDLENYLKNNISNERIVILNYYTKTDIVCYDKVIYLESQNKYINNYYTGHDITNNVVRELSNAEINILITALNEIKADFTKRLKIYLKKYGLSKLHTWTYLSD